MKQKVHPLMAVLLVLVVAGIVGAIMYVNSEPPMADVKKKSFEEARQQTEAMRKGMMGMKQAMDKGSKTEADKKSPEGEKEKHDDKAPSSTKEE